ncbi:MAG: hypothetical protein ABIR96_05645 [Bdellovibrionota bacterium]
MRGVSSKIKERRKLIIAGASFVIGSLLGVVGARSAIHMTRGPASEVVASGLETRNDYAKLPCADETSMKRYLKRLKVRSAPSGKICGEGSDYEKLGKLLRFMDESKFALSLPDFGGFKAAKSPLNFMGSLVDSFNFSGFEMRDDASTVIAYNRADEVFIGPRMLQMPPIIGAATLVHEANHSDPNEPGHTDCVAGELAGEKGACDQAYSAKKGMGSYSVEVQYYLAVALGGVNFSETDREFARSMAMGLVDSRFNSLPDEQASLENIMLLDDKGYLRTLHPIARTLMAPLQMSPALEAGDQARKVLETSGGLLCLSSEKGALRCGKRISDYIDPTEGIPNRFSELRDYRLLHAEQTLAYALGGNNSIGVFQIDPMNGEIKLETSNYKTRLPLKRLLSTLGFQRAALGENGKLYGFSRSPEDFTRTSVIDDPEGLGYSDAMGGYLSDDLWVIQNSTGRLFYYNRDTERLESSLLQCPSGAVQYAEGALMRVLLCKDGSLQIKRYEDMAATSFKPWIEVGSKFVSIGIFQHFHMGKETEKKSMKRLKEFSDLCGIAKPQFDFWTDGLTGIDEQGQLIVTGASEMTCRVSLNPALENPIQAIGFSSGKRGADRNGYAPYGADVTFRDGKKLRLDSNF